MNNKLLGKLVLSAAVTAMLFLFVRSHINDQNQPWEAFQAPLTNWYYCEGKVDQIDHSVCEYTGTPKSIAPRNVGQRGEIFTYFAEYTLKETLTDRNYALNLGTVGDEDKLWVDGQYVGQHVYADRLVVGFQDWKTHALNKDLLTAGKHKVRLEVTYAGPMFGGVLTKPTVTTDQYAQIKKLRYNFYRSYLPFACSVALIMLALYSGLVGVFGRNKSFFYDYMGFGICFALYIGSIGFVYSYMGFDWTDTLILYAITIIGSLFFSARLVFHAGLLSTTMDRYKKFITPFILTLSAFYILMFTNKLYVQCVLLLQLFIVTEATVCCFYITKHGLRLIKTELNVYTLGSVLVGPIFIISTATDLYKQFYDAGSLFTLPYALILMGYFVMFLLAQQHATALRDQEIKADLEVKNEKLKYLSEHDPLTTLYNRRTFESLFEYHLNQANERKGYALLILDIDHFKAYNDSYGHPAGDRLLVQFSQVLKDAVRLSDHVGRLGGEEFGIFLHNLTLEQTQSICENIRKTIEETTFEFRQKTGKPITASLGVIYMNSNTDNVEYGEIYKLADECLYKAKETRNTVVIKSFKGIATTTSPGHRLRKPATVQ